MTGKLRPSGKRTVTLQRYYSGAWHAAGSAKTTAAGSYRFSIKLTTVGKRTYRVTYAGTHSVAATKTGNRHISVVAVPTALKASLHAGSVHVGVPVAVAGTLSPALAGSTVALQR